MNFQIDYKDSYSFARRGRLQLAHGVVETPVFMPVGTYGAVRGLASHELQKTGAEIMLANTYHLMIRPEVETIEAIGGLHRFMSWDRPILTDSGGFQVFSLAENRKITNEAATFRDPRTGSTWVLSPERSIELQERFGSDIMMVLDECPPSTATSAEISDAVDRTSLWAERCLRAKSRDDLGLFCIVQGGCDISLREKSLSQLRDVEKCGREFDGYALGGLSVGEVKDRFVNAVYELRGRLPSEKPHYLMGVGTPRDLVFAVACGIDMFDCVIPSRNGRHGIVMTRSFGKLNLFNAQFIRDERPLDESCPCATCRNYSRALLNHLFRIEDSLAATLCTLHNVVYFLELMKEVRQRLEDGSFHTFAAAFIADPKNIFLGFEKSLTSYPESFA